MININEVIKTNEYDFIRTSPNIKDKMCFLTLGGSHAYGTNVETSDIDIRGVALNTKQELLGQSNFEQQINKETDTTIYAFNKFINLATNCNPNIIELLGNPKEMYIMGNDIGQEIIDNKKLFLSQKAKFSFGGYAIGQLRRLENALAHDSYAEAKEFEHISGSLTNIINKLNGRYSEIAEQNYIKTTSSSEGLFLDIHLTNYPMKDFNGIYGEMGECVKNYSKLNNRNQKKDNQHLNKHALHLIRLYLMAIDIMSKGEINTFRTHDLGLLMDIRSGKYLTADGFNSAFDDLLTELTKKFDYACDNSILPIKPKYNDINDFVISVNERIVKGEIKQYEF